MDLRHAAVLAMAKRAHERDHVQAELMLGERNGAFLLGPMRAVAIRAGGALATADLEPQPHRPVQGDHGATVLVADSHGLATRRTLTLRADERAFLLWPGPGLPACHRRLLAARHPNPQQTADFADLVFLKGGPALRCCGPGVAWTRRLHGPAKRLQRLPATLRGEAGQAQFHRHPGG